MNSATCQQIVAQFAPGSTIVRMWSLTGGVSAQVTALEIEQPDGQRHTMIVRQHGPTDLAANPHIATTEFKLLQQLQAAGIPVPTPYHVGESGMILPTPYIIMEFVDGQTNFQPTNLADSLSQMATTLAAIHQVDRSNLDFLWDKTTHYPNQFDERPRQLDESLDEGRIRSMLEIGWPPTFNPTCLQHGDYWPGNLLWRDGQLVAVIDWEDAALGDPLEDLANTRLEILWVLGAEAMQQFTQRYQALRPDLDYTDLSLWDLCAALRPAGKLRTWGLDATTEKRFRERHHWFVEQAFDAIRE